MAYKPCHIITNDEYLWIKLTAQLEYGYEDGSEDYTEEEGRHYHFLVHWPRNEHTGTLSPTRNGAIKRWRRENPFTPTNNGCQECYNKPYGSKCINCGLFYKIIWCHTPEHANNVKLYIEGKYQANPAWRLPNPEDTDDEGESDSEGEELFAQ